MPCLLDFSSVLMTEFFLDIFFGIKGKKLILNSSANQLGTFILNNKNKISIVIYSFHLVYISLLIPS